MILSAHRSSAGDISGFLNVPGRALSNEHIKLSAMGPMGKISEIIEEVSSSSQSCTSESLSDREHELDQDMPIIRSHAKKLHKSLTHKEKNDRALNKLQGKVVQKQETKEDVESCFNTT